MDLGDPFFRQTNGHWKNPKEPSHRHITQNNAAGTPVTMMTILAHAAIKIPSQYQTPPSKPWFGIGSVQFLGPGWELCKMTEPRGQEAPEYFWKRVTSASVLTQSITGVVMHVPFEHDPLREAQPDQTSIWVTSTNSPQPDQTTNLYLDPGSPQTRNCWSGYRFTPKKELWLVALTHPKDRSHLDQSSQGLSQAWIQIKYT